MMSLGVLYSENGKTDEAKKIYNKLNNRLQDFSKKRREQIKKSPEYQKIKNTIKH
jgi:TolA-binding protein